MNYNVLILHDNKPYMDRVINLGDRALTDGFYNILKQHKNLRLVSGGRKHFPYFNIKNFDADASTSEIENIFNKLLVKRLKKNKEKITPEQKLFNTFHYDPNFNNILTRTINQRFATKYSKTLSETLSPFLFRNLHFAKLIKKIEQADFVLCNTGGLIADHLDFYLPSYLFECFLAKKLGRPVITMNQTISVRKTLNRSLVSMIYGMLDFHVTREPVSENTLIDMGIDENKILCSCDSAFAADYKADGIVVKELVKKNRLTEGGIGISIRGDRPVDYPKLVETIKLLKQRLKKPIVFFATCKAHDMTVYKKLTKACDIQYIEDFNDYRILTNLLEYLDMVITDRYHSAIFSIIAKTPLLVFQPQTVKIKGLFQLFRSPVKVETLSHMDPGTIVDQVKHTLLQKDTISTIFEDVHTQLKNRTIKDFLKVLSKMEFFNDSCKLRLQ